MRMRIIKIGYVSLPIQIGYIIYHIYFYRSSNHLQRLPPDWNFCSHPGVRPVRRICGASVHNPLVSQLNKNKVIKSIKSLVSARWSKDK